MEDILDGVELPVTVIQVSTINADRSVTICCWNKDQQQIALLMKLLGPADAEAIIDAEHSQAGYEAGIDGASFLFRE